AHLRGAPDPDNFAGDPARFRSFPAYGAAKSANILFAAEAARRRPDITSVSFHPGVVRSNFGAGTGTRLFYKFAPFLVPPARAGALLAWLMTTDGLTNGGYYVGHDLSKPMRHASDPAAAAKLWEASAEATGVTG
ncbi:MAG TPA: short-chain dehydrogenase, partial [Actinoplanes sp.]|nr:short-chain dehydrogenase [Actinoplanes sp.]